MWRDQAEKVCGGDNYIEKDVFENVIVHDNPFLQDIDSYQNVKRGKAICLGFANPSFYENLIVSAEAFKDIVQGNTASGENQNGVEFDVFFAADGTMTGRTTNKYNTEFNDSGTWEITDEGQFCETWKQWRNNSRNCFLIYVINDDQYVMKAIGRPPYKDVLTMREGDPEKLEPDNEQVNFVNLTPPEFDLSGVYTSKVLRKNNSNYFCFNQKKTFMIKLKQEDNRITGTFLSNITGKIEGTITNKKVKFTWHTTRCNEGNEGEWTVGAEGFSLQGYGSSQLDWEAQRNN